MYLLYEGHKIEIRLGLFGKEQVFYDGKEVSAKNSMLSSKHKFQVEEKGEEVEYAVSIVKKLRTIVTINPISYIIKRNGETILSL